MLASKAPPTVPHPECDLFRLGMSAAGSKGDVRKIDRDTNLSNVFRVRSEADIVLASATSARLPKAGINELRSEVSFGPFAEIVPMSGVGELA